MAKEAKAELLIPASEIDGTVPWKGPGKFEISVPNYYFSGRIGIQVVPIVWKKNDIFKAAIKFDKILTTASTTLILAKNTETDMAYTIRYSDFEEMMKNSAWIFGVCIGEWKYRNFNNHISLVSADMKI